ncbi:Coenzyme F420 hydrogenase/dehydrogenase, beta subunit C-terminal domain [Cellulomonas edaphi]|uniref:Coenzyme F420 hydrogenase/dehydrogenase, beta subunit C-terminal domain n=1 Tax=Cellulomonas edaphi TaxID=3053468 RepID=A0ABT7S535_9CELL|nr:Coenzyme F420 hydrogenase/dehydrogenase, beta subunit C-terminal domain [Cellulomons edaphi]MDM7830691.1 Coenzyme F420 hydrogenase/dehydrogenase, beta subunit C-terminal domain [Cellulomons edaphi]
MSGPGLDDRVRAVVDSGRCSGCGACTLLDDGLSMRLTPEGYLRPERVGASTATNDAPAAFDRACPGRVVRAQRPDGSRRHPILGPVAGCWEAAATDPELRLRGSSGGVLTALSSWLVANGEAVATLGAAADRDEPRRTVPVVIRSRREALDAAGSRYAPVAVASHPAALDPAAATVGKPCEIAALRALASSEPAPLLLSFFCAGTPSARSTDAMLDQLGVDEPLDDLWYRGRGWPGRFTARGRSGREWSASYDESWGGTLGPTVQWRCKICPDGVGESSDITAGDFWRSDERGYPVFTETDGFSALVARTPRGLDVVQRAVEAGVLTVRPIDPDEVAGVQPLQRNRRTTLAGRLTGARLAGARLPRYRGFGLVRLSLSTARTSVRTARGTFRRVRAGAADGS